MTLARALDEWRAQLGVGRAPTPTLPKQNMVLIRRARYAASLARCQFETIVSFSIFQNYRHPTF